MKVVFVQWTAPYFQREQSAGYNKEKLNEVTHFELLDYEQEFQKLSALKAKKHVGETILYTDTHGLAYLKSVGMVKYYDSINTTLLDSLDYDNIAGKYWTTGKSYVISQIKGPFIFCDLDLYINERVDVDSLSKYDLIHNQWELERSKFYVDDKLPNLNLPYSYSNMLYPNTSFLYINNSELQKEYWKLHKAVIEGNNFDPKDECLWLLADQGILGYAARHLKCKIGTLEKDIFISETNFNQEDLKYGAIPKYLPGNENDHIKINYHHIWLTKRLIRTNSKLRKEFIQITKAQISEFTKNTLI